MAANPLLPLFFHPFVHRYYAGIAPGTKISIQQLTTSTIASNIASGGNLASDRGVVPPLAAATTYTVGSDDRGGFTDVVMPVSLQPSTYQLFVVRTL